MFHESMPFTAVVVVAALLASRKPESINLVGVLGVGAVAVIGGPVTLGVALLLFVALLAWPFIRHRVRIFLPFAAVAVAIPYGLLAQSGVREQAKYERLRQEYPLESLADRVPEPRAELRTPLSTGGTAALSQSEQHLEFEESGGLRTYQLKQVHERSVSVFVESPGFGVQRMKRQRRITDESLKEAADRPETPSQPGSPAIWGNGEPFEAPRYKDREAITELHTSSLVDFVNPQGWGYVQSRERVAGFLSHRFSKVPEAQVWQVQRIELVGLLKHPEPVVYLSDRLPAMTELRDAPTRPLDTFEASGLGAVRKGEDGFAARRGDVMRFVGAIRSAKQCVECHGGQRGDLLGAFTYTLRAKTPVTDGR